MGLYLGGGDTCLGGELHLGRGKLRGHPGDIIIRQDFVTRHWDLYIGTFLSCSCVCIFWCFNGNVFAFHIQRNHTRLTEK